MDPQPKTLVLHPLMGQTLKQYQIEGPLGQGGMGVVYRGHDTRLQRPVAIKLLSPDVTADPERRKRFLREARAAARISHPAVAQVYDVDEHEGTAFIAMEFVEGKTVRDLIRGGELDLLGAIDVGVQVAEGLARAHDLGIVHRDIKPANVMVTRDGHAKILDFGLAKLTDVQASTAAGEPLDLTALSQTQVGAVLGTAPYMSPEQVKGQPVDARSDLFSLGVLLFEMVTGALPFQRDTPLQTMQAIAFDEAPPVRTLRPNLPAELQRIVGRCLQKQPEQRYPDARALCRDLRVLRRDTETGTRRFSFLREQVGDAWDQITHLSRTQVAWLSAAFVAIAVAAWLMLRGVGLGGFVFASVLGLLFYRHIRNQPQRLLDRFCRKAARLPEVRFIVARGTKITVGVDPARGQLYGRVNAILQECNRRLFFGDPFAVVIRSDPTPEESHQLLADTGVQYVRAERPPPRSEVA